MGKPNLFILGASKSGTTSLYRLLERHPDIKVSAVKEPSFFCSHFQVVKNPVAYFALFDSLRKYRVDSSHVYFSNPETAPILADLFPDARFILTLRHPKARAHSLYQHMRRFRHGDGHPLEPIESFHDALEHEAARFADPDFLVTCRHYFWNFMYMRSSEYDKQLTRYFALFPRERFLVMSLAELHKEPARIIQSIGDFLDVDATAFGADIPFVNVAPPYGGAEPESDALMEAHFTDMTARVERLVGHPLDWSM